MTVKTDISRNLTLERSMGLIPTTALVVGVILGAAIFAQPSEISRDVPNLHAMLAVWFVAGLLTFFGAMVCAELASAFPQTGGLYIFLKKGISPSAGFLWGWANIWIVHSGIIAAVSVIVARYIGFFVPLGDSGIRAVAIGLILLISGINYIGIRQGSAVQTVFTIVKVLAIALIFILVWTMGSHVHTPTMASRMPLPSVREFIVALVAGLFAFGGWQQVTYTAGETRDAERTVPRALFIGTLIVTACYLAMNAVYLRVLPIEKLIASQRVATDAATALIGPIGAGIGSALVVVSGFGALNGIILGGARVYFAMAETGGVFRWLSAVHPRYRTPYVAILFQAAWSSVLVMTGTYRSLFTRVVYTEWLFFGLMTVALFRLRKRADYSPSMPMWGYPWIPALFLTACGVIVFNQISTAPWGSAIGLLFVASGLPVFYVISARERERRKQSLSGV